MQQTKKIDAIISGKSPLTPNLGLVSKMIQEEATQVVNSPIQKDVKSEEAPVVKAKKPRAPRVKKVATVVPPVVTPVAPDPVISQPKVEDFSASKIFSLALKGILSLYQNKLAKFTASAQFMYKNIMIILGFLASVLAPAALTYLTLNYVPYIAFVMEQVTFPMTLVYYGVVYIISSVVLITGSIMLDGFISSMKQSLLSLAEVGMKQ